MSEISGHHAQMAAFDPDGAEKGLVCDADGRLAVTGTLEGGSIEIAPTAFNPTGGAVEEITDTASEAVEENADRKILILSNQGEEDLWYGFEGTVTVGNTDGATGGILLTPGEKHILEGYVGSIFGIADTGFEPTYLKWVEGE